MQKRVIVVITAFMFLMAGCNTETSKNEHMKYTYLALGDSYTIGERVDENQRFPVQLVDTLTSYEWVASDTTIVAKTGWTTDELDAGIREAELKDSYDLVTLLIGVNNQYRGRSVENYREEFVPLLHKAIRFAGGDPAKVIVISIPDWGVTPFAEGRDRGQIASEIDAYNTVNKEEAEAAGVKYVDVTPVSRQAAQNQHLVASDGLHPSAEMYSLWVELLVDKARASLVKE